MESFCVQKHENPSLCLFVSDQLPVCGYWLQMFNSFPSTKFLIISLLTVTTAVRLLYTARILKQYFFIVRKRFMWLVSLEVPQRVLEICSFILPTRLPGQKMAHTN